MERVWHTCCENTLSNYSLHSNSFVIFLSFIVPFKEGSTKKEVSRISNSHVPGTFLLQCEIPSLSSFCSTHTHTHYQFAVWSSCPAQRPASDLWYGIKDQNRDQYLAASRAMCIKESRMKCVVWWWKVITTLSYCHIEYWVTDVLHELQMFCKDSLDSGNSSLPKESYAAAL